jgi:hypothetical protein
MNTFDWLVVGHLVGDWLLQNDWMAMHKRQRLGTLAGIVHYAIYTLTITGSLWLSNARGKNLRLYLGAGVIVFVTHWLIDGTDCVQWWMRLYRQSDLDVIYLMVDQVLHVVVLVFLAVFFVGNVP